MNRKTLTFPIVLATLMGCASIVGDRTQTMPITSTPDGARVTITDESGVKIFDGDTPANVLLDKSDGSYWGKKSYQVEVSKPGYAPQKFEITASPNGWYLAGNLVFGGLIGWFIVDPLNGAMYTLSPKHITSSLEVATSLDGQDDDVNINLVLIENVPVDLRRQMRRLW